MFEKAFLYVDIYFQPRTLSYLLCNNNNNQDDIYSAVIMTRSLREFTRFIWRM